MSSRDAGSMVVQTVEHDIPMPVVVVDSKVAAAAARMVEQADTLDFGAAGLEGAEALVGEMKTHLDALEVSRKEVKAPVLDLGKAVDRAARMVSVPLDDSRRRLLQRILDEREAQRALHEAEQEERQAAEEAAAEAAEPDPDDDALAELAGEPAPRAIPSAAPAPRAVPAAPAAPAAVVVPDLPEEPRSSVVSTRKKARLVVEDIQQVPEEIQGARLWERKLDERLAIQLIQSGMSIPGLSVVVDEIPVQRRG